MVWVKICGVTRIEDAIEAAEAGANAVGFIFAPSKRQMTANAAKEIIRQLPAPIEKVGVFVNASAEQIREVVLEAGLTAVQLHGDESPEFASSLFAGERNSLRVMKVLAATEKLSAAAERWLCVSSIDAVLVDTAVDAAVVPRGGTGNVFDWASVLPAIGEIQKQTRVVIAGGLSPDNVADAVRILKPWGVDVSSGVEAEPRKKSAQKIRNFIAAARAARN